MVDQRELGNRLMETVLEVIVGIVFAILVFGVVCLIIPWVGPFLEKSRWSPLYWIDRYWTWADERMKRA